MTVMFLHSCLPQANNSNLPSGGCLVITKRCLLLFTLGFEHCKQRNVSLHCQTIYFISLRERSHVEQASFSCCPGVGLIHLWAWVWVSLSVRHFLCLKFVMAARAGASSDWLSMPSRDGHSFWLDGDYLSALCSVETSETGWQRQHSKMVYLVCSTICMREWLRENITPDQES